MAPNALASCLLLGAVFCHATKLPAVHLSQRSTGERTFRSEEGRELIFHGVNAIVKGPPWHPVHDEFSLDLSMTDKDFEIMHSLGLNLIRLGMMWPGVEPQQRGQYNTTYLDVLKNISTRAAQYGIYTLLDMHQDVLSEAFCGEGIPKWAVHSDYGFHFFKGFPAPLAKAYTDKDEVGFPTRQDCAKFNWPNYYQSEATASAFQALYSNQSGLLDAWGEMWAFVAKYFKDDPNILGLELINEPYAGNFYTDPLIMVPIGKTSADVRNLGPAYDALLAKIRREDSERLVMFAGVTWDDLGSTFTHAPLNDKERTILAYHYCTALKPDKPIKANLQFAVQMREARRLGTGLMLTETCNPVCAGDFTHVADAADAHRQSFASWEWKTFCRESDESKKGKSQWAAYGSCKTGYGPTWNATTGLPRIVKPYARTYPQRVAGNISAYNFDTETGHFKMQFSLDKTIATTSTTEIFVSKEYYYQKDLVVKVAPAGVMNYKYVEEKRAVVLTVAASKMALSSSEEPIVVTVDIQSGI